MGLYYSPNAHKLTPGEAAVDAQYDNLGYGQESIAEELNKAPKHAATVDAGRLALRGSNWRNGYSVAEAAAGIPQAPAPAVNNAEGGVLQIEQDYSEVTAPHYAAYAARAPQPGTQQPELPARNDPLQLAGQRRV